MDTVDRTDLANGVDGDHSGVARLAADAAPSGLLAGGGRITRGVEARRNPSGHLTESEDQVGGACNLPPGASMTDRTPLSDRVHRDLD